MADSPKDALYRDARDHIVDFAFNDDVAAVFPDMIRRSVLGYETVIPATGLIAAQRLGDAGHALDLGCSLGATAVAIARHNASPSVRITGIDNSPSMIERARALNEDPRIDFVLEDLVNVSVEGADVVVCNFVLQFLDPEVRLEVLTRQRRELQDDALLIVSEKVAADDPAVHELFDKTHLAWKAANGYSQLEISQKRNALENVMRIDSEAEHLSRFAAAGFSRAIQWYRCLNWASFLVYP